MKSWKEVFLQIFATFALVALNLMWIFGIDGEIRATAITFDVAYITLALNRLRIVKKNGESNG